MKPNFNYQLTDLWVNDESGLMIEYFIIIHFFDNEKPMGVKIVKVVEENLSEFCFRFNLN